MILPYSEALDAVSAEPKGLRNEGADELFVVHLPDGLGRLEARERRDARFPFGCLGTRLELKLSDQVMWRQDRKAWRLEDLQVVDLDHDGRQECVVLWRGEGTGARLLAELWRFDGRAAEGLRARRLWELEEPVVEGELRLEGDGASGHLRMEIEDVIPGPAFKKPYLRRRRSWYLDGDVLHPLGEAWDEPATWRQRQALLLHLMKRGDWSAALPVAERLVERSSADGAALRRRALRLRAVVQKRLGLAR